MGGSGSCLHVKEPSGGSCPNNACPEGTVVKIDAGCNSRQIQSNNHHLYYQWAGGHNTLYCGPDTIWEPYGKESSEDGNTDFKCMTTVPAPPASPPGAGPTPNTPHANRPPAGPAPPGPPTPPKSNSMLYIGVGVAIVVIVMVMMLSKQREQPSPP